MGLDVYLYHCKDRKTAKELEDKYEDLSEKNWKKVGGYDKSTKEQKEEVKKKNEDLAIELGLTGQYNSHPTVTQVKEDSKLYLEHMFKVGYFRSSYNSGGINHVLRDLGIGDLYYIFNVEEQYEFTPDWKQALSRVEEVILKYTTYLRGPLGNLSVMKVRHNPYSIPTALPQSEKAAVDLMAEEINSHTTNQFGDEGYSNRVGEFFPKGVEVVGFIPGMDNVLGSNPCLYVIYKKEKSIALVEANSTEVKIGEVVDKLDRKEKDWYLQSLEVVKETIEFVLSKPNPEEYYFHWSG